MGRVKKVILSIICLVAIIVISELTVIAHEWMAPKKLADIQNPLPATPEVISHGNGLYLQLCSNCHGEDMAGLSVESTGLQKTTPNLKARLKNHSDGDFFWKIQHGKGDMPSFKDELNDEEIWSIVHLIRSDLK